MPITLKTLNKQVVSKYLDRLVNLDISVGREISAKYGNEPWNFSNFTGDYPKKWEFSQIAISGDKREIGGFVIASEVLPGEAHIHRFAINQRFRRTGVGSLLMDKLASVARQYKCLQMTVDVSCLNTEASSFYQRCGFKHLEGELLKEYALLRKKDIQLIDNFVREPDGAESYILYKALG